MTRVHYEEPSSPKFWPIILRTLSGTPSTRMLSTWYVEELSSLLFCGNFNSSSSWVVYSQPLCCDHEGALLELRAPILHLLVEKL